MRTKNPQRRKAPGSRQRSPGDRRPQDRYTLLPDDDEPRYTTDELYTLWQRFKDAPDAVTRMQDFSLMDKTQAARLIMQFEQMERGEVERIPILRQSIHDESDFMW